MQLQLEGDNDGSFGIDGSDSPNMMHFNNAGFAIHSITDSS